MPIKRGAKDCPDVSPQRRRSSASQNKGKKLTFKQAPLSAQRVTRSKAKHQRPIAASKATGRDQNSSPTGNNDTHSRAQGEPLGLDFPEQPISQQSQPLSLSREALQLLNNANRTLGDSVASASGDSEASDGSLNAYHPAFEQALNDRYVFFFEGKLDELPNDLDKLQTAVFAQTSTAEPPEGQAGLVRRLLTRVRGEPDMVSQIMPEIVPFERLKREESTEVAVNQLWRRCLALDPDIKPSLATPKPDVTIGWNSEIFSFQKANKNLRSFQSPVSLNNHLSWPLFTIEIKGEGGCLRHAQLQNLYNAAVMLSNLRELMKAALKEAEFFNKIHVLSLELTVETVQLSCYWATCSKNGQVVYYGKALDSWGIRGNRDASFNEAYRCIHNAIDLVRSQAYPFVYSYMNSVEQLFSTKVIAQIPSPRSMSNQRIRKNRSEKAPSTKTSSSKRSSPLIITNSASQRGDA
ncbi:hypothetical protein MMC21_007480 [Puttea exsequens]|nr:hypothetical protein [Puttea exsequens]